MRKLILCAALLWPVAVNAQQVQILKCPPHLSYCYYEQKPVEPKMREEDELNEIRARVEYLRRQNDIGMRELGHRYIPYTGGGVR